MIDDLIEVAEDALQYFEEFAGKLPQSASYTVDGQRRYFSAREPVALRDRLRRALESYYQKIE